MTTIRHQVFKRLQEAGAETFYTGGCVRDELIGLPVRDLDVVIFNLPADRVDLVLNEFGHLKQYGKCFPVRQIKGLAVEFALPRSEAGLTLKKAVHEDALRRDFTVDALYRHTITNELIDPLGKGLEDLNLHRLRMTCPDAFSADPLRVYRAFQLASRLNFEIEPATLSAMSETNTKDVSPERILQELNKWLLSESPAAGWRFMKQTGFLPEVFHHGAGAETITLIPRILTRAARMRAQSGDPLLLMWGALLAPLLLTKVGSGVTETQIRKKQQEMMDWYGTLNRQQTQKGQLDGLLTASASFFKMTHRPSDVKRLCLITDFDELELLIRTLLPLWKEMRSRSAAEQALHRFRRWRPTESLAPVVRGSDLKLLGYPPGKEMGIWLEAAFQMQLEGVEKEAILIFFRNLRNQIRS